jgi:hypothetical protein
MDYPQPSPNSATFKRILKRIVIVYHFNLGTQKNWNCLTWLTAVTSHFHNATFILPLLISGSQPDDDTMGSKHVAEWIIL